MRNEQGHVRGIDELGLMPILNEAEQHIAFLLKICKLFAGLHPFQLGCLMMNEISILRLNGKSERIIQIMY